MSYFEGPDRLAHHISALACDAVELDEFEQLLIGLFAHRITRPEMNLLQAQYLREAKPRRLIRSNYG
ncbi:hypothetical protein [Bradyrhizobium sp. USDA 4454]